LFLRKKESIGPNILEFAVMAQMVLFYDYLKCNEQTLNYSSAYAVGGIVARIDAVHGINCIPAWDG